MRPYYEHKGVTIYHGDCREVLPRLKAGDADCLFTDPPYGIGFSGYESHEDDPAEYGKLMRCVMVSVSGLLAMVPRSCGRE